MHLYDLSGQTETPGTVGVPPHLMHAKTILFDLSDGTAALWTGSHNATQRALFGINIEAALVAILDRTSPVYRAAQHFIENVRAKCEAFDPSLSEYYKWLQGEDRSKGIIELEDALDAPIPNTTITLFGVKKDELSELKTVDKEVLVSLTSSISGRERFYCAGIEKTGHLRGVQFDPCRYAFRSGSSLPILNAHATVPTSVTGKASYFVSLALKQLLPEDTRAYDPPEKRWVNVEEDYLVSRLPERQRSNRRADRDKRPHIRKAAPPEVFLSTERTLDRRRQEGARKLLARVVLQLNTKLEPYLITDNELR